MPKKANVFGVDYSITNYDEAAELIIDAAKNNKSFGVSALAVHGLMECYNNHQLKNKVNKIDLIVPDGQPVKWAINSFYKAGLKDRVCGPVLTLEVLKKANAEKLAVFLYGSKQSTLDLLCNNIQVWFPDIKIAGVHADRFRDATPEEDMLDIEKMGLPPAGSLGVRSSWQN
jgi:UDP-N-acetyl-D-mannosaminuronic acid transferase (WecB/TagA/CpsF family)